MPFGSLAAQAAFVPPEQRLALRIAVDTVRGAEEGVPVLIELLQRFDAKATFLFALGPDRSGRTLGTYLGRNRPRIGPIARYGYRGLLRGTLWPGADLGARAEAAMRAVVDAGFEAGIGSWSAQAWLAEVRDADAAWTREAMQRAVDRCFQIIGHAPRVHGACQWRMNRHAFRLTQRLGFDYCSDTRGSRPYVPVIAAEIMACPQIPTTLPTFSELASNPAVALDELDSHMLLALQAPAPEGHVLALDADCEGLALRAVLERLLVALRERDRRVLSLAQYVEALASGDLPRYSVDIGETMGSAAPLARQEREFLA